jgi:hypothetical protein
MVFGNSLQPRPSSPQSHITSPSPLGQSPPRPNRPSGNFARPNPSLGSLPSDPTQIVVSQIDPSVFGPSAAPASTSSLSESSISFPQPSFGVVAEPAPQKPPKRRLFGRNKKDQPGDATTIAMGVTEYVLTALQSGSRLSRVPFLPEAATMALTILQGVQVCTMPSLSKSTHLLRFSWQGSHDNKDAFHRLAVHGCNLISSVIVAYQDRLNEGGEMPRALMLSIQILVEFVLFSPRPLQYD